MKMQKEMRTTIIALLAVAMVMTMESMVHAVTAPVSGSFAYDVYDIAINNILKGPIGFVGGVACVAMGAIQGVRGAIMQAVPAIIGGAAIIKADAITESLGMLI